MPELRYDFASDNTAGICPEALAALHVANSSFAPSYGEDALTQRARNLFRDLFATDCDVYFVFNGTAANALSLAACCRDPFTRIICHELAHVDTDECGAPEFFTGGAKLVPIPGNDGKLSPASISAALQRGHGIHYPKPGAISLTETTEVGTLYQPAEIAALADVAHRHGLAVHMDGARFANALASLQPLESQHSEPETNPRATSAADVTWRSGVDVLCFGGTKNGMLGTEAVVFFNRELARHFDYRVKQSGQLASKMRFAAAQWIALLESGMWLRYAAHANRQAERLANQLREIPGVRLLFEREANSVFVELPRSIYDALTTRGWQFYRFIGEHGYRLVCSWATTEEAVDDFIRDVRAIGT